MASAEDAGLKPDVGSNTPMKTSNSGVPRKRVIIRMVHIQGILMLANQGILMLVIQGILMLAIQGILINNLNRLMLILI